MISFECSNLFFSHCLATIITLSFPCIKKTCFSARLEPQLKSNCTEYIKASCGISLYPEICYKTLSSYASTIQTNPMELANAALSVSLKSAQSTSNMVLKVSKGHDLRPNEASAIRDCVETTRDSVDELQKPLLAMKDLEGPDFDMQISNIKTWVSAALTCQNTCMEGFEGNAMNGKIKNTIRSYIVIVSQLTSNALAFINRLI